MPRRPEIPEHNCANNASAQTDVKLQALENRLVPKNLNQFEQFKEIDIKKEDPEAYLYIDSVVNGKHVPYRIKLSQIAGSAQYDIYGNEFTKKYAVSIDTNLYQNKNYLILKALDGNTLVKKEIGIGAGLVESKLIDNKIIFKLANNTEVECDLVALVNKLTKQIEDTADELIVKINKDIADEAARAAGKEAEITKNLNKFKTDTENNFNQVDNKLSTTKEELTELISSEVNKLTEEDTKLNSKLDAKVGELKEADVAINKKIDLADADLRNSIKIAQDALTQHTNSKPDDSHTAHEELFAKVLKDAKDYADDKFSEIAAIEIKVVDTLPDVGKSNIIYLIKHEHTEKDIYDEYIWVKDDNKFEKIGSTDIEIHKHENKAILDTITADSLLDAGQKEKLNNIEAGAQVNSIEKIKANGEEITIVDKTVDLGDIIANVPIESISVNGVNVEPSNKNVNIAVPVVPAWALADEKPTYDASEVGARPVDWVPAWTDITNVPTEFTPASHEHTYAEITDLNEYHDSTKQNAITSSNKLTADLITDENTTNKFTSATEKAKLADIESNAQVNIIEKIKANGEDLVIVDKTVDLGTIVADVPIKTISVNEEAVTPDDNKNVNISVPTKMSELEQDIEISDVEANPEGVVGGELNRVKINNVIYEVRGGTSSAIAYRTITNAGDVILDLNSFTSYSLVTQDEITSLTLNIPQGLESGYIVELNFRGIIRPEIINIVNDSGKQLTFLEFGHSVGHSITDVNYSTNAYINCLFTYDGLAFACFVTEVQY